MSDLRARTKTALRPVHQNHQQFQQVIQKLAGSLPPVSTSDLIPQLRRIVLSGEPTAELDEFLRSLFHTTSDEDEQTRQTVLLLIFVPTIHKTCREIRITFPRIGSDDAAQQAIATFLSLCQSRSSCRTHPVSLSIARRLRCEMFRWAVKEARNSSQFESIDDPLSPARKATWNGGVEDSVELTQLLDHCQTSGDLSAPERALLAKVKVEGFEPKDIARASGRLTANAVRVRVKRIVARVRKTVRSKAVAPKRVPHHKRRESHARAGPSTMTASA